MISVPLTDIINVLPTDTTNAFYSSGSGARSSDVDCLIGPLNTDDGP
jgi:hypothetical protein